MMNTTQGDADMRQKRKVGRPRCTVSAEQVRELREQGLTLPQAAQRLRIGRSTAARLLAGVARSSNASRNPAAASLNSPCPQPDGIVRANLVSAVEEPVLPSAQPVFDPPIPPDEFLPTAPPRSNPIQALEFRRVRSKPIPKDDRTWPVDEKPPGPCPCCGSRAWRLNVDGSCICSICKPLR